MQVAAQGARRCSGQQQALTHTAAAQAPFACRGFAASAVQSTVNAKLNLSLISTQLRRVLTDAARHRQVSSRLKRLQQQTSPQRRGHASAQPAAPAPPTPASKAPAPAAIPRGPPQRSVWQRTRDAAGVPGRALGAVASAGSRALSAAYRVSPSPVRRLVESARSGTAQKVLALQLEAFWQQHRNKVFVLGGIAVVYILWCGPNCAGNIISLPRVGKPRLDDHRASAACSQEEPVWRRIDLREPFRNYGGAWLPGDFLAPERIKAGNHQQPCKCTHFAFVGLPRRLPQRWWHLRGCTCGIVS